MMNRGYFKPSIKQRIKNVITPDFIMRFLTTMRKVDYYTNCRHNSELVKIALIYNKIKYRRLSLKLGFSIGSQVFGYGLVIPHYGTIVVGSSNRVGNYAVLHTSICITDNGKQIGDGLYVATGAKITSHITLGDNVSVGANSVVNKSFRGNVLLVGMPAVVKQESPAWFVRDGVIFSNRVLKIEELKHRLTLDKKINYA